MKSDIKKLIPLFSSYKEIKLVYLFGSRSTNDQGPLSDYDFAVYFHGVSEKKMSEIRLELYDKLSRAIGSDKLDIVVLNFSKNPYLKFEIIKNGKIVLERAPFRLLVEPKILNEYFDFKSELVKNNLTKIK